MASIITRIFRKALSLLNNPLLNRIWVLFSLDGYAKKMLNRNDWSKREYNTNKTLQENVGFSHHPEIQKRVDEAHKRLVDFCEKNLPQGASILDIGCGTGLYLKSLDGLGYHLYGVDLNERFIEKAQQLVPSANFVAGSYMKDYRPIAKLDLICSFSVLEYIEPSGLKDFFKQIYFDLQPSGYVFMLYPHALTFLDLMYPDITYIKYSPRAIERAAKERFNIIRHEHFYDGRKLGLYDRKHYYYPDTDPKRLDTIENNSILILQKK